MEDLRFGKPYSIKAAISENSHIGLRKISDSEKFDVVILESNVEPDANTWIIERIEGGQDLVRITCNGHQIGANNGKLIAGSDSEIQPEIWKLLPSVRNGKNAFAIAKQSGMSEGWVVEGEEPGTQVLDRILIVGPAYPPFYPPNEVFVFQAV